MAIVDLLEGRKVISIIGLAKNTGKTVVLKKIISELNEKSIPMGITSIGHDGEEFDQINHLIKKPRIFLPKGSLVATTDCLFRKSKAKIKILKETKFITALGKVQIGRVMNEGNIEIAGSCDR